MRLPRSLLPAFAATFVVVSLCPVGRASADSSCAGERGDPRVPTFSPKPATLRGPREVRLGPAEQRTVGYDLTIPADARRLDVYFHIDTTGSMGGAICGLQRDLLNISYALADAGIDARFGLAEFRDYPMDPYGSKGDWAYRQDRDIGPLDRSLVDSVGRLEAGGGGDGLESSLAGLFQTATGSGQDVPPKGPSDGDIAPGKQAHFRPGALMLVINITDAPFREPNSQYRTYPGPSYAKTAAALRERRILQAGIAVSSDSGPDLERMARSTGAMAPAGGVDCDGDGTADLAEGAPLVCTSKAQLIPINGNDRAATNLAPAIVNIVKSLRDVAEVKLRLNAGKRIVKHVDPASVSVDLKAPRSLHFTVGYTCAALAGSAIPVNVSATVRDRVVASMRTRVICAADAVPISFLPVRGAAAPAPPAQDPVTQSQAQAQSNAQAQGQGQAQAQTHAAVHGAPVLGPAPEAEVAVQHTMSLRRIPPAGYAVAIALVLGCAALVLARGQVQEERVSRK